MTDPDDRHDAIGAFWRWTQRHRAELDALDSADSEFFDALLEQLKAVDEGLWLEVSTHAQAPREFVVSAGGDPALFALAEAVAAAAPELPGWQAVALKPPMGFDFGMRWQGIALLPAEMRYQPLVDRSEPEVLGLRIAVPGFLDELEDDIANGVLTLLDTALGERSAAVDVALVEVCALPAEAEQDDWLPLVDLSNYVEWRRRRLAQEGVN